MRQQLANGHYALCEAQPDPVTGLITPRAYRLAYRKGYFDRGSSECIISIRKSNSTSYHDSHFEIQGSYGSGCSLNWVNRFPWADGTPFPEDFPWEDKASWPENPFFKPDPMGTLKVGGARFTETRDPRLYENVGVPGDIWRDGTVGRAYDNHKYHQDGCPGFLMMKYVLQQSSDRTQPPHWCMMRFAEVLLNCAEAYNEADGGPSDKAYAWVNAVRARVGLKGLVECNPDKNLLSDKNALLEEILRERACELDFNDSRYFDLIRYKRADLFEKTLHRLLIFRLDENGKKTETQWYNGDRTKAKEGTFNWYEPSHFEYERTPITNLARVWWTEGFDPKWYLTPFPLTEVNKGYGLVQNPGW